MHCLVERILTLASARLQVKRRAAADRFLTLNRRLDSSTRTNSSTTYSADALPTSRKPGSPSGGAEPARIRLRSEKRVGPASETRGTQLAHQRRQGCSRRVG